MKLWCHEDGGHEVTVGFRPVPGERVCPKHHTPLGAKPSQRRPLGRKSTSQTPAYYRARDRFNTVVLSRPCFFADRLPGGEPRRPGHECAYPLDAHHLVPKDWIKRELGFAEPELLVVMFDPILGAPLCRAAHEAVELRSDYIYFDELDDDLIAMCQRVDAQRPDQPSMFERLRVESPERPSSAAVNPQPERTTNA